MCIHKLFEKQVKATPQAIAIVFEGKQLTYQELNEKANQLAHYLIKQGSTLETLIGLCVERSLEMVIGLLGILKAGGAYVPLESRYPQERLSFMQEDAQVKILLTQSFLLDKVATPQASLVCLDTDWSKIAQESCENPLSDSTLDHLAYVMYTSGSTGKPKGVCVLHRGMVRLVKDTNYLHLTTKEVFLQVSSLSFDPSMLEIWGALLNGGQLVIMPPHLPALEELGYAIRHFQVSTLVLITNLFHMMVDTCLEDLRLVRQILTGGDILSVSHAKQVLKVLGSNRLINVYGPTENSCITCCYPMTAQTSIEHSVPIGRPISQTQIYVLNKNLKRVPPGHHGELYTGGAGLARGYLNRPQLTAECFVPNPFTPHSGSHLYKTGDLVRYRSDGNLEFLGRLDNQVKLRGFRIELGEIETTLTQHPKVQEAVVIAREDHPGDKRLAAYLVAKSKEKEHDLRPFLKEKLPDYMIPATLTWLDTLPLNPNGKIDRQALPQPEESPLSFSQSVPQTPIEQSIVTLWQAALHREKIGIHDNFFDLGGNSLLLVKIYSQLVQLFKQEISVMTLFRYPTVHALAHYLESHAEASPVTSYEDRVQKQKQVRHQRRIKNPHQKN